jgi:hypothetical protein
MLTLHLCDQSTEKVEGVANEYVHCILDLHFAVVKGGTRLNLIQLLDSVVPIVHELCLVDLVDPSLPTACLEGPGVQLC